MTVDHTEHTDFTDPSGASESASRGVSRRTVLFAGWSAPVIMAIAPAVAFAASGTVGGTTHTKAGGGGNSVSGTGTTTPGDSDGTGGTGGTGNTPGTTPGVGGITEQQHAGAEPARINRGFTG
jgi:hypothetical protein